MPHEFHAWCLLALARRGRLFLPKGIVLPAAICAEGQKFLRDSKNEKMGQWCQEDMSTFVSSTMGTFVFVSDDNEVNKLLPWKS